MQSVIGTNFKEICACFVAYTLVLYYLVLSCVDANECRDSVVLREILDLYYLVACCVGEQGVLSFSQYIHLRIMKKSVGCMYLVLSIKSWVL